ncbi:putative phage tail protein [Staphylococcus saprophyticus]|uniref:BppU family phage baseplate upper protein n=1 Tax=Staphylococcus saprophyticus TaxID=29385 RepID=UPI000DFD7135|nr:BppU family phage baseplate upper protein [Staphylococcus saprophyticus]SUM62979.1 putative phage tail protein [Staphylococcus saprophyticus]
MSMNKIANIKLETTANYQSLSGLNVQFWNQDKGTAVLQFNITRNNYPLALSEENVKVFIALEAGDSFLVDDNLDYVDELNGIVAYTIPTDFMRVAKNVVGQVYVTTLDQEETIVQRKFTFDVANDLIASLPAEDKIREIKYFADMRAEVAEMMTKLNNDFENMNDYVSQVNQTTEDGIAALSTLIQQKQDAYNANHTAKMKELNDKGSEYSAKFDDDKVYMDDKFQAFQESVNGSGLITTGQTGNWQKYKLTDDDGNYPNVSLNNDLSKLQALPPGFYYGLGTPITISGVSTSGFIEVSVKPPGTVKHIVYRPYNVNKEFVMRYYDEWSGWENKMDGLEKTIDAQSKANTAENNAKQYTDEKMSTLHEVLFTGSVNGVSKNIMLNDDYNNFDEVRLFYSTLGGSDSKVVKAKETNQIVIHSFNLTNSDGSNGDILETTIDRVNGTTLKISNEVRFNLLNQTGGSTSGITITEIIGVKY